MASEYSALKVQSLKELLQERGLLTTGKKTELIERLCEYDTKAAAEAGEPVYDQRGQDVVEGPSARDVGEVELPGNGKDVRDNTPNGSSRAGNEKDVGAMTEEERAAYRKRKFGIVTNDDKLLQRAKKFGLATPEFEEEKRRQRALRFSLPSQPQSAAKVQWVSTSKMAVDSKTIDPGEIERRKKRVQRFGIVDEEEKRKKRAERFGTLDEKSKQQKRLERFGNAESAEKLQQRKQRFGM